jgi:hypothetical protein
MEKTFDQSADWSRLAEQYGGKVSTPLQETPTLQGASRVEGGEGLSYKTGEFLMNAGYGADKAALNTVSFLMKLSPVRLIDKLTGQEDAMKVFSEHIEKQAEDVGGIFQTDTKTGRAGQFLGSAIYEGGMMALGPKIPGKTFVNKVNNKWVRGSLKATRGAAEGIKDIGIIDVAETGELPGKAGIGLGAVLGVGAPAAGFVFKKAKNALLPGAQKMLTSAIKPMKSLGTKWESSLDNTIQYLAEKGNLNIRNLTEFRGALNTAKADIWANVKQSLGKGTEKELTVDGDIIANKILEVGNNPKLQRETPELLEKLKAKADVYKGKIPVEEAEEILQQTNAELEALYRSKNINKKLAASDPMTKADMNLAVEIRKQLDTILDGLDNKTFAGLKKMYGDLVTVAGEVEGRWIVNERQNIVGLAEQLGYADTAGKFMSSMAQGNWMQALGSLGQGSVAKWLKLLDTADNKVMRAFMDLSKEATKKKAKPSTAGFLGKEIAPPSPVNETPAILRKGETGAAKVGPLLGTGTALGTAAVIGTQLTDKETQQEDQTTQNVTQQKPLRTIEELATLDVISDDSVPFVNDSVVNTVFSEVGNLDDMEEEAVAMALSIQNRKKRLEEQTNKEYSIEDVLSIPKQYLGRSNSQYNKAQSGKLDKLSSDKYDKVSTAINNENLKASVLEKIKDYDSFSKGLEKGVTDYIKIGDHYFYKMPTNLRTK